MEGKEEPKKPLSKDLRYVEGMVDGKPIRARKDTKAMHNASRDKTKRLGLLVTKEVGWLKAGDVEAKKIHETTHEIQQKIGLLEGLKLTKGKGVRDCIIEGDSLMVISWRRGERCGS